MDHLDAISVEDLQRTLDDVDGKKPTQRLLAAIAYKNGVSQTELAEWHDVQRKTIYSWLTRLDGESLERAVTDAHRPGRPPKLSPDQRTRLERTLHEPPTEAGYDALAWTPPLVRQYLNGTFDVDYSLSSCRRLMRDAGLRYRKPRRVAAGAERDDRETPGDEFEASDGRWSLR